MDFLDNQLVVKTSTIPNAGRGLFTKKAIAKGTRITEYIGKVSTWKDADHAEGMNAYIYFVNRNFVIDANGKKDGFAHFANDGVGYKRMKGVKNNAEYVVEKKRVYLEAIRDIGAGEEIMVAYGKDYWDVIKKNGVLEAKEKK